MSAAQQLSAWEIERYRERVARDVCRKVRYTSALAAAQALNECQQLGRDEKRAYRCFMCGGHHLTSSEQEKPGAKTK